MRVIGTAVAVLLIGACATAPSQRDGRVLELIDRFNTLPAGELVANTGVPFLLDDQVLYAESDVEAVLARVKEAGLVLTPQIDASTGAVAPPASARFDVGVFHDRLPDDTRIVTVESTAGPVSLVVGGKANRLPLLLGLKRGHR